MTEKKMTFSDAQRKEVVSNAQSCANAGVQVKAFADMGAPTDEEISALNLPGFLPEEEIPLEIEAEEEAVEASALQDLKDEVQKVIDMEDLAKEDMDMAEELLSAVQTMEDELATKKTQIDELVAKVAPAVEDAIA